MSGYALRKVRTGEPLRIPAAAYNAFVDAAIANRIRDIIHELDGYEDVTVAVKAGIVTLRGTRTVVDYYTGLLDEMKAAVKATLRDRTLWELVQQEETQATAAIHEASRRVAGDAS